MRAEFVIEHETGEFLAALRQAFGPHSPKALTKSAFHEKSPGSARAVEYAALRPNFRVLAWSSGEQVFLYVESLRGHLRVAAAEVWDIVRKAAAPLKPRLKSLVLFDEDANDALVEGRIGVSAQLRRPELILTLAVGAASAVWLGIAAVWFGVSGDLVLGTIPALVAAILSLGVVIADVRSKRVVWR